MYEPKVNDYVVWHTHPTPISGWVYFADHSYITIEMGTSPKDEENIRACPIHRNNHILVVCYPEYWNQLEYVTSRKSIYDQTEDPLALVGEGIRGEGI
jgi:hypothetical protein